MKKAKKFTILIALISLMLITFIFSASAEGIGDYQDETWPEYDSSQREGEYEIYEDENGEIYGYLPYGDGVEIIGYSGDDSTLYIPSLINGLDVVSIGPNAFSDAENLIEVIIPANVEIIHHGGFNSCDNLQKIVLGENLVTIDDYAFAFCDNLKTVDFGEALEKIGFYAFGKCYNLESITLPESVLTIGDAAFALAEQLKSVHIGSNVTKIGKATFYECIRLESISAENIREIEDWAFYCCFSLENAEFGKNVISIGNDAFSACIKLSSAPITQTTESIGDEAFSNCWGLNSITFFEKLTHIGTLAFVGPIEEVYCYNRSLSLENTNICFVGAILDTKDVDKNIILDYLVDSMIAEHEGDDETANALFNEFKEFLIIYATPQPYGTLYGYKNSSAEAYATANGITFVAIDEECTHKGGTATCIEKAICDNCGEEYGDIDADKHKSVVIDKAIAATCTKTGLTEGSHCDACDKTLVAQIEIGMIPHYGGTASCKEAAICEGCGDHYGELKNHTPSTYTQNASCTVNGYTVTSCSVCGEQLAFSLIMSSGHDMSDWYTTKNATCNEAGEEKSDCSKCSNTETRTIPKLEHNWSAWATEKEASIFETGLEKRVCSLCGKVEEKVVPKIESKTATDKATNVTVEYTDTSYSGKEITVKVEEDFTGSQYLLQSYSKFVSWNIKTYYEGNEIQPNSPVIVTLPLPSDFDKNMLTIYHINSITGTLEKISPIEIGNDYVKFLATSFSVYMIVDESSIEKPDLPTNENCSCNCHKSGFMGFIWKIIIFFQKLFKTNQTCACGIAHY